MFSVTDSNDTGSVPAFLKKLWILVEDSSWNDLICWGENGTSFHVYDQSRFAREVLPLYFKHNNIASFIRQLNMYGFRKVMSVDQGSLKVEKDDLEFHHAYFQQGHEELMENIKRKVSPGVKVESIKLKQEDVSKVLADVRNLRGKQDTITAKMDTLKRENEALWREVANLRQKHLKQQQIVNKLIQFLVTLVRGNRGIPTNSRKRVMPLMLNNASQINAKQPKLSRQLSIEETSKPYTVQSPSTSELDFTQSQASGPIIHEVTDSLPNLSPHVTDDDDISPDVLLSEVTPCNLMSDSANLMPIPATLPSMPIPAVTVAATTPGVVNMQVTSAPIPTSSVISADTVDRGDMTEQLDILQTDINELKDLLSGGQYSLDTSMLLGLFSPESPLSKAADTQILQTNLDGQKPGNTGTILGNELIQYEPQEDLSNLPLFDLGDTGLTLPGLEDMDDINDSLALSTLPESQPTELHTPQIDPDQFLTNVHVKREKVD
ncbi:heat shock factor protein 1-like isoform X1 [Haliotis rufescens]|uniref:heat shock factor protein 1-like isoform X1 n=1 Tax=Haliotis rufescens TaxID=6454 RepID=UPI001EB04E18|nr:heat shock factor protein 1-like isoform X1 [Haliotis rufescens]